ncbi:MAG: metabolite traffic protein EboE [Actinomycetes bacterium]
MRLRHPDGTVVHLAYCTNVHAARDLSELLSTLETAAMPVRERLGAATMGLGLWLPRTVAAHLVTDEVALDNLGGELARRGLEVVTLNGFPFGDFHADIVRYDVYRPDWSDPRRLRHTVDLARILAHLLPEDAVRGSISTLPLGWRTSWAPACQAIARKHLDDLAAELDRIEDETGRAIRVGLEPEPGCAVETTADAVEHLTGVDTDRIGLCLDTCHLAVAFEDPDQAVTSLAEAGIPVVKTQAACALVADDPADESSRGVLAGFDEPRYLHQVREQAGLGRVLGRDDLAEALDGRRPLSGRGPWRVHFHVPLHADPKPPLRSTRDVLDATLGALFAGSARTDHVEVETYTWGVLPPGLRPDGLHGLTQGIASEMAATRDVLVDLGLEEST